MQPRYRVRGPSGFGSFSGSPPPRDVIAVLAVVFLTFALQFFETTSALIGLLRLTPAVFVGFLWQIVTYPFIGFGGASFWFLLELFVLFWVGREVFYRLGRKRFWKTTVAVTAIAAGVAVLLELILRLSGSSLVTPYDFILMQGQRTLVTIWIAAFATMFGEATILLFFIIPVKARWFLWLEVVFLFFGYLNSKDLVGFVGGSIAVLATFMMLSPGGWRIVLKRWRLRFEQKLLQMRASRRGKRRKFEVVEGGGDKDRWVH